jgi:hypothetical protein
VADHLGVEFDDLVLTGSGGSTYTFRRKSTDEELVVRIDVGPEGPVVQVEDPREP